MAQIKTTPLSDLPNIKWPVYPYFYSHTYNTDFSFTSNDGTNNGRIKRRGTRAEAILRYDRRCRAVTLRAYGGRRRSNLTGSASNPTTLTTTVASADRPLEQRVLRREHCSSRVGLVSFARSMDAPRATLVETIRSSRSILSCWLIFVRTAFRFLSSPETKKNQRLLTMRQVVSITHQPSSLGQGSSIIVVVL